MCSSERKKLAYVIVADQVGGLTVWARRNEATRVGTGTVSVNPSATRNVRLSRLIVQFASVGSDAIVFIVAVPLHARLVALTRLGLRNSPNNSSTAGAE